MCIGQTVPEQSVPAIMESKSVSNPPSCENHQRKNQIYPITCSICQKTINDIAALKTHIETEHSKQNLPETLNCPKCQFTSDSQETMRTHMRTVHYLKCSECQNTFLDNDLLQKHYRETHIQSCGFCNYETSNKIYMDKHIRSSHPAESVAICGVCSKTFSSPEDCSVHIDTHTEKCAGGPVPIFPCDNVPGCNNIYLNIKQLSEHKEAEHVQTMPEKQPMSDEISGGLGFLETIKRYMEFYHNQSNMVHDDQNNMILHIINSLSSLDTALNLFTGEIKKELENIMQQLSKCTELHKSNVSQESAPVPSPSPSCTTKPKILIVGTSLNNELYREVVEHATDSEVTMVKAFTVDADQDAYKPETNFMKVVPEALRQQNFNTLVLQCGPNEITNLNTSGNNTHLTMSTMQ